MAAAQFGACVGPGALIFVGTAAPLAPMSGSCPFLVLGLQAPSAEPVARAMPMLLCRARPMPSAERHGAIACGGLARCEQVCVIKRHTASICRACVTTRSRLMDDHMTGGMG